MPVHSILAFLCLWVEVGEHHALNAKVSDHADINGLRERSLKEYARFNAAGNEAKKLAEMKSDASCKAAIRAYEDVIAIGESLIDKIDWINIPNQILVQSCRNSCKR